MQGRIRRIYKRPSTNRMAEHQKIANSMGRAHSAVRNERWIDSIIFEEGLCRSCLICMPYMEDPIRAMVRCEFWQALIVHLCLNHLHKLKKQLINDRYDGVWLTSPDEWKDKSSPWITLKEKPPVITHQPRPMSIRTRHSQGQLLQTLISPPKYINERVY